MLLQLPFFLLLCFFQSMNAITSVPNVLIVYYSSSASQWTRLLARTIANASTAAGANTTMRRINETTCNDLIQADAIALGSPVYWSSIAGAAKVWLDNIQSNCFGFPMNELRNKVGVAFATGGHVSDGKDSTMGVILTAWRAMEMITVSCAGGVQATTACNPWGTSATHSDTDNRTVLSQYEIDGAIGLGQRIVEVAGILKQ